MSNQKLREIAQRLFDAARELLIHNAEYHHRTDEEFIINLLNLGSDCVEEACNNERRSQRTAD